MRIPQPVAARVLALCLWVGVAAPAFASPGYVITKIALEGEAAPGTADAYGAFFDVQLDESGGVAFSVPLASGFPNAGVFVDPGGGAVLRMRNGDAPPPPIPGSYIAFGGMVRLDGAGRVTTPALVNTGSGSLSGLFMDDAGSDSTLVAAGDPAPAPPGGTLDAMLADINVFGVNAAGDLVFRSDVSGGSAASGVFLRSNGGGIAAVALLGDAVGGGPDAFSAFGYPTLNDTGQVAFGASVSGGAASAGLFLDSGAGPAALAWSGDAAPDTGGGSLVDFLYPAIDASGRVAFLSNVSGGTASGGVFVASPAVAAVAVEGQAVPGAGPIDSVSSVPDITSDGKVPLALSFASGPVAGGVYLHSGAGFDPVALDGDPAPDAGGAAFASFGFASANDAGQVAFVATLDDARTGVFLATPTPPQVPMLPAAALLVTAALIVASVRRVPLRA